MTSLQSKKNGVVATPKANDSNDMIGQKTSAPTSGPKIKYEIASFKRHMIPDS